MSPSDERIAMFFYAFLQLPIVFYHPVCEYFFNGASPGKKILKIKVVHMDGSSSTLGSYLMRWMMYMLECLLLPGIGLLCIIFNKNGQRLGDMMAGTVVIKSDDYLRHRINLNDANLINSPYYYVQQNDVIYVEPNATKAKNSSMGQSTSIWISVIGSLVSVITLVYNIAR